MAWMLISRGVVSCLVSSRLDLSVLDLSKNVLSPNLSVTFAQDGTGPAANGDTDTDARAAQADAPGAWPDRPSSNCTNSHRHGAISATG